MLRRVRGDLFVLLLAFSLAGLVGAQALAATLTGSADRTSVEVGETFTYVLSLAGGDSSSPPDVSAVTRDFDIVGRRRGSRTALVDGKRTTINEWVLMLSPKRAGQLIVPALSLAGLTSAPVGIQVVPAAAAARTEERSLFIEMEAADGTPFAQSQVPVVVRIYDALGIRGGGFTKPTAEGATFTEQGDQQTYFKTVGKKRFQVIEQGYLMQPQRSGTITIPPVTLQAKVPAYDALASDTARLLGRGGNPVPRFDNLMDPGRDVTLKSNPVTVEVRPRPAQAQGWFLPARGVTISSSWSAPPSGAKPGETLTRTIRLEARGASPNQLPPLPITEVEGLRQYEDETRLDSALVQGEPGAVLTKTISVVPARGGTFTLPPITVAWWNTKTDKQETAVLPVEAFTIAADPRAEPALAPPPAPAVSDAATQAAEPPARSLIGRLLDLWAAGEREWPGLAWMLPVLVVLAFAMPWLGRRLARLRPARKAGRRAPSGETIRAAEQALKAACRANDAAATHQAYLALSRLSAPGAKEPFRTEAMGQAMADLRGHLYGGISRPWNGAAFHSAFQGERKAAARSRAAARRVRLAPLYPEPR